MSHSNRQYYTLDRDPASDDWDTCPGCNNALRSRDEDPYRDDYEIYEFFVCDSDECRVLEAVIRHEGTAPLDPA